VIQEPNLQILVPEVGIKITHVSHRPSCCSFALTPEMNAANKLSYLSGLIKQCQMYLIRLHLMGRINLRDVKSRPELKSFLFYLVAQSFHITELGNQKPSTSVYRAGPVFYQ